MKCFRCNFVPFFLQTSLKVGNSTGSSLSHFALQNAAHILYWRQVGTAGRPVKYPYPLPPQPGLCNVCRMWFCIVLLKYAWMSLEKMSSWRQHIVLQNLYVLFSINGAITEVQVTFAKGTDTTPYHDRPWLLDLLLVTVWMILFFFGPEHTASIPPKKYLKYWFISWHTVWAWCFPSFVLYEDLPHVIFTYFQCRCGGEGVAGGVNGCVERCSGRVWGVFSNLQQKTFKSSASCWFSTVLGDGVL